VKAVKITFPIVINNKIEYFYLLFNKSPNLIKLNVHLNNELKTFKKRLHLTNSNYLITDIKLLISIYEQIVSLINNKETKWKCIAKSNNEKVLSKACIAINTEETINITWENITLDDIIML